jgi:hypothetical protein
MIEPGKALQQSGNSGWVPFAARCRWYPSRVQLSRDGLARDKARCPDFKNCRAQGFSSHVRDPLQCKVIVGSTMF